MPKFNTLAWLFIGGQFCIMIYYILPAIRKGSAKGQDASLLRICCVFPHAVCTLYACCPQQDRTKVVKNQVPDANSAKSDRAYFFHCLIGKFVVDGWQMGKCADVQMCKCVDVQMGKCAEGR